MYTGQIDVISNRATWISDTYEVVDEDDGTTIDLSNVLLSTDIVVTIRGNTSGQFCDYDNSASSYCVVATASTDNGKVTIPGPGFEWRFENTDLSGLCAGTYIVGAKVTYTTNGTVNIVDLIIGTVAVKQGN